MQPKKKWMTPDIKGEILMLYKCSCGVYGHSSKGIKLCPSCGNKLIERKDIKMAKYFTLSEAIAEIEKDNTKAFISEPIQTGSAVQGKTVIMEIKKGQSIKFRFPEGSTNLNDEQKKISLNRKWLPYDKNKKEIAII